MIAIKNDKFDFDRTQKLDKMTSTSECITVIVGVIKSLKHRIIEKSNALNIHYIVMSESKKYGNKPLDSYFNIYQIDCYSVLNKFWSTISSLRFKRLFKAFIFFIMFSYDQFCLAQTETFDAGAYVVNMGISPQTEKNALKPYGMIYDLIKNYKVEIKWSIHPSKSKDGIDFSHNGISYKGGPFIIPKEYRTTTVNARIVYWQNLGVVGATTVSSITVPIDPIYGTLRNVPRWTLDKKNGKLAVEYFLNAGIPQDAFGGITGSGWKDPSQLNCCDDLFVLPHADPVWSTHNRLYTWNQECKGGIWNGCHSGSALENMVNTSNRSTQTNFLTTKDPAFTATSGNYANSNSLMLWSTHQNGSPPYINRLPSDPVAQYIGSIDGAFTNGSEQIFIPRQTTSTLSRWNSGTKIIAYDPSHTNVPNLNPDLRNAAAVLVYGRGFGDLNRGFVMHSAGHSYDKCQSSPAHVAAQRAFFNFSWMVATDKAEILNIVNNGGSNISSGVGNNISFNLPGGNLSNFTIQWSSTCGGTFTPSANQQTLQFIPPPSTDISGCVLSVSITDACGRTTTSSQRVGVFCDYNVTPSKTNPKCKSSQDGSIIFNLSGSSVYGTNDWNWTRDNPIGSGSGTASQINGLRAGTYKVTVTSFTGCSASFTTLLTEPNSLDVTATPKDYQCFGQKGSINLTVSGGSIPYSYSWNNSSSTANIANLSLGTYTVTVTDINLCTKTATAQINGPVSSFAATLTKTDVSCAGGQNGSINLSVSGGQPNYFYLWSDGQIQKDLIGLSAGNYIVTVTDVNGCQTTTSTSINQPLPLTVNVNSTHPDCQTGTNTSLVSNGNIALIVSGGTSPYTYIWNNGVTSKDRANLPQGSYAVTITDTKGCQNIKNVTLVGKSTIPNPPTSINK